VLVDGVDADNGRSRRLCSSHAGRGGGWGAQQREPQGWRAAGGEEQGAAVPRFQGRFSRWRGRGVGTPEQVEACGGGLGPGGRIDDPVVSGALAVSWNYVLAMARRVGLAGVRARRVGAVR